MRLRDAVIWEAVGRWKPRWRRQPLSLALLVSVLGLPVVAAEPEKKPAAQTNQPEVLAEFNIEKAGRPILLPVRIQEREYLFVLDTGTSGIIFDTSLREILGKPISSEEARTAGDPIAIEHFNPPEAFLGRLDLRQAGAVVCSDLERFRRVLGKEIRGVMGMRFLKNYVVRVNFDSGKVEFRSWDGRNHPEWGSAVYLLTGEGRDAPYVKGNLAGVGDIKFVVDSGYSQAGTLATEVFERAMDKMALAEGLVETAAGTRRYRVTRSSRLTLGGFNHRGLLMDEGNENSIGLGLLSRYVVTLDFLAMKMYLQQGQAFDKPDEIDISGLHLWRLAGRTTVHSVDKDSPAEAAGVKPEDVILKVGEQSTTEMDIDDLRDLLKSGDGKEIQMTIKRGDAEKAVRFKLKKKI